MRWTSFVPALLGCFLLAAAAWGASRVEDAEQALYQEWSEIYYKQPRASQAEKFKALLLKVRDLRARHPGRAEPLIIEAITLCTLVGANWTLSSLSKLEDARQLLVKSIDLNPDAMDASAFITLGNLYAHLPGWPISFGNDDNARHYLEMAVKLQPDAVDSNYFLGDFWLSKGKPDLARPYLEKAARARIRARNFLADSHTKEETLRALAAARQQKTGHGGPANRINPAVNE